jgi:hypothetical protein
MEMTPVESEAIAAVGHDPHSRILRIRFKSGLTYEYPDVSMEAHQAFVGADSIGRHFHKHIRANHTGTRV